MKVIWILCLLLVVSPVLVALFEGLYRGGVRWRVWRNFKGGVRWLWVPAVLFWVMAWITSIGMAADYINTTAAEKGWSQTTVDVSEQSIGVAFALIALIVPILVIKPWDRWINSWKKYPEEVGADEKWQERKREWKERIRGWLRRKG